MSVIFDGYKECYNNGVVACLKRNYESFKNKSLDDIANWLKPVLKYKWEEECLEDFPYKYGTVIISDKKVVGYLGAVYSKRYDLNGKGYIFLRPTTWAIDEKYRIYLFKGLKEQFKAADVIGDFAPRESVEHTLVNLYKFKYCEKISYKFQAIPYFGFYKVDVSFVKNSLEIDDKIVSREFRDNQIFDVKCAKINDKKSDAVAYILYKIVGRKNNHRIMIMKIAGAELISMHIHEIFWRMMWHESAYHKLKCDGRFFRDCKFEYPFSKSKPMVRLLLNKRTDITPQDDFLYSDTCMLEG